MQMCVAGVCVAQCAQGQLLCQTDAGQPYCVDAQTDNANCGSCGHVCPVSAPVCAGGVCTTSGGCLQGGKNPPAQCTNGTDPQTASPYVVCSADCSSIWISCANNQGGTYHAQEICNQFGYSTLAQYGGNCGDVCGYCQANTSCSAHGTEKFDNGGNCGTDQNGIKLCITVMWQCTK
jgi:hypothetical protein